MKGQPCRRRWTELVPCQCWCQATIVGVTQAEVLACTTRSCGRSDCRP